MAHSSLQEIVCCMGQPVAGNPMQYMMEKAFAAAGLDLRFLTLEVTPDHLADAVRGMRAMGFRGAILLDPHQATVVEYADQLSRAAQLIGEVNFLDRDGEQLTGDNTVGKALLRLVRQSTDPTGKPVVILGAGSAARSAAVELALEGVSQVVIVNRTAERGQQLAELVSQKTGVSSRFDQWVGDYAPPLDTALVVQAASIAAGDAGRRVPLKLDGLAPTAVVVDMRLNPPDTQLLRDASARGLAALDGLDVLVNQAVIAFCRWTGVEPDQSVMHEALEEFLML